MEILYPITFLYYRDLERAIPFYRDILGLPLAIDQGWCKIYSLSPRAMVGLVDEKRGSLNASDDKAVVLSLVVEDVDAWHRHLSAAGVADLTAPKLSREIGVYGFFCHDPEGYKIEVQAFVDDASR